MYESQKLGPTARANFDLSGLLSLGRAYAPIVNKINGYETFAGQNGAKEHGQFFCFLRRLGPEPKPNFLLFEASSGFLEFSDKNFRMEENSLGIML